MKEYLAIPVSVDVSVGDAIKHFSFLLHCSKDIALRKIEDEFYLKYSLDGKTPKGDHYEIEICFPDVSAFECKKLIHFHASLKDNKNYICWTRPVPTLERALEVIKMWSAGTVYTIEKNIRFDHLFSPEDLEKDIFDNGLMILERDFGIVAKITRPT